MQERAERRHVHRLLAHRNLAISHHDGIDAERWSAMGELGARNQLASCDDIADDPEIFGEWRTYSARTQRRQSSHRDHEVGVRLIGLVEHLYRLDGGRMAIHPFPFHMKG
jgi:hypothetical protein